MRANNDHLDHGETEGFLTVVLSSELAALEGSWQLSPARGRVPPSLISESLGCIAHLGGRIFFVHAEDFKMLEEAIHHPDKNHTVKFKVVSPELMIHEVSAEGMFRIVRLSTALFRNGDDPNQARHALTKYQELFMSIDQGFAMIELLYDDNGTPLDYFIEEANPALERLTGFRGIAGQRISQILPSIPTDWLIQLDNVVKSEKPTHFTAIANELGGGWFNIYAFPIGLSSPRIGILFTDISERVLSEERLRNKQLQLEIAQKQARVGIWTYYPAIDQGMASEEWMELMGYSPSLETWTLKKFLSFVDPEDVPALRRAFLTIRKELSIEAEFRIHHPRHGLQWYLIRGSYISSEDPEKGAAMGSVIDITDRKAFEEQKDAFIAIASHELKTPVTSVKAYAEIVLDYFTRQGNAEQSTMMERMVSQINRLTRLINDLLDTTRITGGGLLLEPEEFNLTKLIHERVEEIQRTTLHQIVVNMEPIPPIVGDRGRIGQVIMNLLSNAIKYSPPGSDIIVSSQRNKDHVIIKVRDYGIGLSPEAQHKIFDRFYRASDSRVSTVPGLGLGLFIASEIIKSHQGIMGVRSEEGSGAEFFFTLPFGK